MERKGLKGKLEKFWGLTENCPALPGSVEKRELAEDRENIELLFLSLARLGPASITSTTGTWGRHTWRFRVDFIIQLHTGHSNPNLAEKGVASYHLVIFI